MGNQLPRAVLQVEIPIRIAGVVAHAHAARPLRVEAAPDEPEERRAEALALGLPDQTDGLEFGPGTMASGVGSAAKPTGWASTTARKAKLSPLD